MYVVYGTKKKIKRYRTLEMQECVNCGHKITPEVAKEAGYFHIYYIPLFPVIGTKFLACPYCGISRKLTGEEFKNLKNS